MSDASGSLTLDTSQAVSGLSTLMQAFSNIQQSGMAMYAAVEEAGSGLEDIGNKALGAVSSSISAATQIQSAQAQLTAQSYNFGESLGQNQAQSKAMTNQLINMATQIKQPISSVQQLAVSVAGLGYSGQQIPAITKDFAEFGAVTGVNANQYAKSINQIAVQTHTSVGSMNSMLGALYAVGKTTSGGMPGLLSMTDRMSSLSLATGMSGKEFIALAGYSQDFDSRLRGGAFGALQDFDNLLNKSINDPANSTTAASFFQLLGNGSEQAGKKIAGQADTFDTFQTFLENLRKQGSGAVTTLSNLGITGPSNQSSFMELANNVNGGAGQRGLSSYLSEANQAWASGTDVQQAYQAIQSTTASDMTGLKDTVEQLANTIGQDLLPAFNQGIHLFQDFAGAAQAVPAPILAIGAGLAGVIGLATVAAGVVTKVVGIWKGVGGIVGSVRGGSASASRTAGQAANTGTTTASTSADAANTEVISANTAALTANTAALEANAAAKAANAEETMASSGGFMVPILGAGSQAGGAAEEAGAGAEVAAEGMTEAEAAAGGLSGVLGTLSGGFSAVLGAINPVTAAIAVATAGFIAYTHAQSDANSAGKNAAATFSKGFDTSSVNGINQAVSSTNDQIDSLNKKGTSSSWLGGLGKSIEHPFSGPDAGQYAKNGAEVKQLTANVNEYQNELTNATQIAKQFWNATPTNAQINQVLSLAKQNMIDLGSATANTKQEIDQLLTQQQQSAASAASTTQQENIQNMNTLASAAMDAVSQQVNLIQSSDSVASAQISEGEAARALANYSDSVANAQNQVAEAELGVQEAALNTAQAQLQEYEAGQQLANLGSEIADAQNKVAEANTSVAQASNQLRQAEINESQAAMQLRTSNIALAAAAAQVRDAQEQQAEAQVSVITAQITASQAAEQQSLNLQSATLAYAESQTQAKTATDNLSAAQWNEYKISADYALQYQAALNQLKDTTLSLQSSQISAANAQWQLTYLQEEGASSRDIELAQLALAQANQQVTDTQTQLQTQQQNINQMPTDHSIQLAQAQDQLKSAQEQVTASAIAEKNAQMQLSAAQKDSANNTTVRTAQIQLAEAQDKVKTSAESVVSAQEQLNALQSGSLQVAYQGAVLAVQSATQKEYDASYSVITAQEQLNTLQHGSIQLAYQSAVLQVHDSLLKQNDANHQVISAQQSLNNLEDGSVQLAYKKAVNQVTAAELQHAQAATALAGDMSVLAGGQNQAYTQVKALAQELLNSGNPQLEKMGHILEGDLPALMGNLATQTQTAGNAAQTAGDQFSGFWGSIQEGVSMGLTVSVSSFGGGLAGGIGSGIKKAAEGAYLTSPTLLYAGEAGPEVVLPINDPTRSFQLLQEAGLVDAYGMPTSSAGLINTTAVGASSVPGGSSTVNNFYLNALTQPADPTEIADAFFWKQRLVSA